MKKYVVSCYQEVCDTLWTPIEVEANSPEEAKKKALDALHKGDVDQWEFSQCGHATGDPWADEVEEIEAA